MRNIPGLCVIMSILVVASACTRKNESASGSIDSTDKATPKKDSTPNKAKTLQFEGYEVTLTPQEDVGEIINVKDLKNNRSFVISQPNGWFFAVIDNLLILDVGTGATFRNFSVYDLDKNEKVLEGGYYSSFEVENKTIRYRKQITIEDESKKPKCPPEGNGFVEEHILDLKTLLDSKTGKVECVYFE